jgi:hypothetical protein
MATIANPDEERPIISPRDETKYASKYETVVEKKILRDVKQTQKHTIMTMTLNEIIENTIQVIATFGNEYKKHLYQVNQDFQLHNSRDDIFTLIKQYLIAFIMYLRHKDNILYIGIILCFVSIIIYFFNISTS